MKTFTVYEGKHKNDNDFVSDFYSKKRAIIYAKKSKYTYVVVMEYDGTKDDRQAYFRGVIYEEEKI